MEKVKLQLSGVNHIYKTAFLVGDAYDIIEKMRKGDAYFNNFYSDDNIVIEGENYDGLLNTPIHLKNKKVKFFNLHLGGGAWIPIFKEISRSSNKGIYIESTAAELCPWNPLYSKKLGNNDHKKVINEMVENSLKSKPLFKLDNPSMKIIMTEAADEVTFVTTEDTPVKVDYKKSNSEVYNQLFDIYANEDGKIKFSNFDYKGSQNFSLDFCLFYQKVKEYDVYEVRSLIEDLNWYSNYFEHFYELGKLNEKISHENTPFYQFKNIDEFYKTYGIEKINDEDMKKFDTYQYQISLSGFLHGYYLLPSM